MNQTEQLLNYLGRGGKYQYYWRDPQTTTIWFESGNVPALPKWDKVYFGVHPGKEKLDKSKRGGIQNVTAVNCLFADFDIKHGCSLKQVESLTPEPSVIIASGGGWHCYWLLDKPVIVNDKNRDSLDKLEKRWVDYIGSDTGANNLAQILRAPGSTNNKYDPARPVEFIKADFDKVYTMAELVNYAPPPAPVERKAITNKEFPQFEKNDSGAYWLNKALADAQPGNRNRTGFWLACQLRDNGILENDARWLMVQYSERVPGQGYSKNEALASLKEAYTGSRRDPAASKKKGEFMNNTDPTPPPPETPPDDTTNKIAKKTSWTIAELYETEFPEPNWIVPGIIQEGLVMLAGRPKIGKSWLALQIACGVATGGKLFDKDITQGAVLYLALEDNARRIKDRSKKMAIPKGAPIRFEFNWRPLHQGGLNDLLISIEAYHYRLIIIDTLARALPGVNHNDENPIGPIMDQLQSMAINHGMTILPADHTRKSNGFFADPIDDVMGSTSKSRALDAILAIYTERGKAGATLKGRGRETEELDLALKFDGLTGSWQSLGDNDELREDSQKWEVYRAIEELAEQGEVTSSVNLAKYLKKNQGNVYRVLADLQNEGKIKQLNGYGKVKPWAII